VVATKAGGIPEVVRDGRNGVLVPVGSRSDLGGALVELLRDSRRRAALGAAARSTAEGFRIEEMVRRTEAVYRDVLRGHRR
jgi:glycosyltransferase involved in cell wall biosynthesis